MNRLLALLLLLPACLLAEPLKLVKDFTPSDETAAAMALYQEGEGTPAQFAEAFPIFEAEAEQGDPVAQFYAGQLIRQAQGTSLDYQRAYDYFEQAGQQGVAEAWTRIAVLYEHGKGREKDLAKAITYYERSMELDPSAMNSMATHIIEDNVRDEFNRNNRGIEGEDYVRVEGRERRYDRSYGVELLQKSIAGGDVWAMNNLGYYHTRNRIPNANGEEGLRYLKMAAERGKARAWYNIAAVYRNGYGGIPKDEEKKEAAYAEAKKAEDQEIGKLLEEAVYVYQQEGVDAGLQRLDEKGREYISGNSQKYWVIRRVAWWEAQTKSGRSDANWALGVFQWIYDITPEFTDSFSESLVSNIISSLEKCGRLGEIGRMGEVMKHGVAEDTGVDINILPVEALNWKLPKLPAFDQLNMPLRYTETGDPKRDKRFAGELFTQDTSNALGALQVVSISTGNWRDAIAYSRWQIVWAAAAKEQGDYPAYHVMELKYSGINNEAGIYQRLGFRINALKLYQEIIDDKPTSYGGSTYHDAVNNLARMEAECDLPFTFDADKLLTLREESAKNKFETTDRQYQFDVTLAYYLRREGRREEAIALLNKLVEMEIGGARSTRVLWDIEDGNLDRAEADLLYLLEKSRDLGLIANEPGMYRQYSQIMEQRGDLKEAIRLMHESIDLYTAIDLYTWIPQRYQQLAALYLKAGHPDRAAYYLGLAERLLNTPGAEYPGWLKQEVLAEIDTLRDAISARKADTAKQQPTYTASPGVGSPGTTQTAPATAGQTLAAVDLQPLHQIATPLKGQHATGIFTLSNLSMEPQSITLRARGPVVTLEDAPADGAVFIDLDGAALVEREISLTLTPEEQRFISVELLSVIPAELTIGLEQPGAAQQAAIFSVPEATADGAQAVINAAMVRHSPFYSVSIFHVMQRIDGAGDLMNLRFAASRPTRIEGYDQLGALMFVDADGDGAFQSSGDVLRADRDYDGAPDIQFSDGEKVQLVEISFLPLDANATGELIIEVAHREGDDWIVDAEDRVVFSNPGQ